MSQLNQLKAEAYDCLVQIEQAQARLQKVNQQIIAEMNKPKEEPKAE